MKKSKESIPEKKLQAIAHTLNMSESDFEKFLRTNGLHSTELNEWK